MIYVVRKGALCWPKQKECALLTPTTSVNRELNRKEKVLLNEASFWDEPKGNYFIFYSKNLIPTRSIVT